MPNKLVSLSASDLRNESVDTENAAIYGVTVITSGVVARGHDLEVDLTTLTQMHACASKAGQVPVKVDHKSGAAAVCGYLDNFRIVGAKLKADWHLLQSHPQTPQILETAERMPAGVGLSASFLAPEKAEAGKARCEELLSVDYVTLPAANPDGLFSARVREEPAARRKSALVKVARVVGAGALGAVGAAGIAARGVDRVAALGIRRLQPSARTRAGIIGAAGALGAVHTIRAVSQGRKRPAYADERREFDTPTTSPSTTMKNDKIADRLISLIDRYAAPRSVARGAHESGTLDTLPKRLSLPDAEHVQALIESGRLTSKGPVNRNDPHGSQRYSSDDLDAIRREVFADIAERVVEDYAGEPEGIADAVESALALYVKGLNGDANAKEFSARLARAVCFGSPYREEDRPSVLRRAIGAAAVGGLAYGGLAYLRGRNAGASGLLARLKAGNAANVADLRKVGAKVGSLLAPRPRAFSAYPPHLTPANARALLVRFGRELRGNGLL